MYIDLAMYDKTYSNNDIREGIFTISKHHFNGIGVNPCFLTMAKELLLDNTLLICPIDYPNGTSDVQTRNHMATSAIKKGATALDLVVGHHFIANKEYDKFSEDIKSKIKICDNNNIKLRVLLECSFYEQEVFLKIIMLLKSIGVEYIIPSIGDINSDLTDNLIVSCMSTERTGMSVISNGNVWMANQLLTIQKAKIFGFRLKSLNVVKNLYGGV